MKIVKATRSAYERQVLESVTIQKERRHNLMNNKAEGTAKTDSKAG